MKKINLLFGLLAACTVNAPNYPDPFKGLKVANYENGLSTKERNEYYYQDEGIQYLPYDVISSFKRPNSNGKGFYDELFLERPERLGLYKNILDPSLPPIGITISDDPAYLPLFGIACATCHTSVITYQGQAFIVDGASSLFAIDRLIQEMVTSIILTLINPVEFNSFYKRYQSLRKLADDNSSEVEQLSKSSEVQGIKSILEKQELSSLCDKDQDNLNKYLQVLNGKINTTLTSGAYPTEQQLNSRIKMFGYLVKRAQFFLKKASYAKNPTDKLASQGLGRSNPWGVTKNMLAAEIMKKSPKDWPKQAGGPVNTPTIWNFEDSKWIFLSGVTNSMVERNLAQGVALLTDFNWDTYETTVSIRKLEKVSSYARKIKPPVWPEEILGEIDLEKAIQGKFLFEQSCAPCHKDNKSAGPASISYLYTNVWTDQEYAKAQTEDFYGKDLFSEVLSPFLLKVKAGVAQREQIVDLTPFEKGRLPSVWAKPGFNAIEAKPLYGIWSSPPYLHNGSVPTIKDLLSKPERRPKSFWMGSMEYDPVNLGFKYDKIYYSSEINTECDKCLGNSNDGHVFGTNLSETEKFQLIEYLKWTQPESN